MDTWDEIFYALLYNSGETSTSGGIYAPAESNPLGSDFVRDLFMSAAKDTALPDLLTNLIKSDWYVPIDATGDLKRLETKPGEYRVILEAEHAAGKKAKDKKTNRRNGKGGRLMPLHIVAQQIAADAAGETKQNTIAKTNPQVQAKTSIQSENPRTESESPSRLMKGRSLIKDVPDDVDGFLFHLEGQTPFEVGREHFDLMRIIADECDLEECIVSPGPDQVEKLLQAKWWVQVDENDRVVARRVIGDERLVYVRVRQDRTGLSYFKFIQVTGEQLFRSVVDIEDAHGLVIDEKLGSGEFQFFAPLFSLECIGNLLDRNDTRVGVKPLPARTLAEINLWLQFRRYPYQNRRLLDASHDGETLVRAVVPDGHAWTTMECLGNQCFRKPVWSPVFSLPSAEARLQPGFGDGRSKILCPGLLAKELNASAYETGPFPEKYWRPGRNLLLGRLLDDRDIEMSQQRLELARELEKLLPDGMDSIPRAMMRSVEGAAFLEKHPHGGTRKWITATVKQAERYTKRWVPN